MSSSRSIALPVKDHGLSQSSSTESTCPARSTRRRLLSSRRNPKSPQCLPNSAAAYPSRKRLSFSLLSLRRKKHVRGDADLPGDNCAVQASLSGDQVMSHSPMHQNRPLGASFDQSNNHPFQQRECQGSNVRAEQKRATRKSFLQGLTRRTSLKDCTTSNKGSTDDSEQSPQDYSTIAEQTKVVADLGTSPARTQESSNVEERVDVHDRLQEYSCATAILEHHFLERFCGTGTNDSFPHIHSSDESCIPEDPTVQESIECIFASQLEGGLNLWDDDELDHIESRNPDDVVSRMVSPSLLQQSRENRSDRVAHSLTQSKKRYEQASLVYVGTFDPTISRDELVVKENGAGPLQCRCERSNLPALAPEDWPQAPILLCPTPGSGTKIKGVRLGNAKDYMWEPGMHLSWSQVLAQRWGVPGRHEPRVACCERCAVLPINNGNELENEELSIDFESDLFIGTLLVRVRHTEGTTKQPYDDNSGYFYELNRRYQAVIRGRFKKCLPFTELSTGFQFQRRCGRLPAKWILRGGIKVLSFFAPQLDCQMEGDKPHSLTPLGSTPQVICVDTEETLHSITAPNEEPRENERSLLGYAASGSSSIQRARVRKKAFDKLFVQKSEEPRTDPSKIYTFEFLQHLLNFQDFSIELGSMLGSVDLKDLLDGQPLQIMAAHGDHRPWSFDIWHQKLWDDAQQYSERLDGQTLKK